MFEHIDQLTLFDVNGLFRYWRSEPPAHVLIGAYMGIKPEVHKPEQSASRDQLIADIAMFGGTQIPNV
jgi:hypothetical protein